MGYRKVIDCGICKKENLGEESREIEVLLNISRVVGTDTPWDETFSSQTEKELEGLAVCLSCLNKIIKALSSAGLIMKKEDN